MTPTGDKTIAENAIVAGAKSEEPKIEEPRSEDQKKRIPMASIPVTILIGLLIAALYLGGRILTAHRSQKPAPATQSATRSSTPVPAPVEIKQTVVAERPQPETKPLPATQAAAPAPAQAVAAVAPPTNAGDEALPAIEPHSGERYLQVGALDPDANDTRRFVERLRGEGLDPHIAEGPTPALMRVLIGPFTRSDVLNEKKAQIESEGIDTFVREY